MNIQEINEKLELLPGWNYNEKSNCLTKTFTFKSYLKNISFVNAIAWVANKENHHPDLEVTFSTCVVKITTHDEKSVTVKDFLLATKIENI